MVYDSNIPPFPLMCRVELNRNNNNFLNGRRLFFLYCDMPMSELNEDIAICVVYIRRK